MTGQPFLEEATQSFVVVWPAGERHMPGTRGTGQQGLVSKLRKHCDPDGANGAG